MLFLIKRKLIHTINRSDVGVFWGVHSAFVSDFCVTPNGIVGRDGCLGANAILLIFRSTWRLDLYTNDTVICNRVLFSYKSKRYRYRTKHYYVPFQLRTTPRCRLRSCNLGATVDGRKRWRNKWSPALPPTTWNLFTSKNWDVRLI